MQEILPGVRHWTTYRDTIGAPVSSYWIEAPGLVIDPMVPDEGLDAFGGLTQVVLTTGLHDRNATDFAAAFAIPIRAPREARDRLADTLAFTPYDGGDVLAPGVEAVHIGVLCPDEYALWIDAGAGAIAFADAVHLDDGVLRFFPDSLLGDDPEAVKAGLRDSLATLLERDFDHLLCAHGGPLLGDGKAALERFVRG
jgi:hypothetical protein